MSRYERIRVLSQIGLYCVIVMYWIKTKSLWCYSGCLDRLKSKEATAITSQNCVAQKKHKVVAASPRRSMMARGGWRYIKSGAFDNEVASPYRLSSL